MGQWACYEAHVKLNDAGQSNGVFELSVNGQSSARRTGLNWAGAYNAYGLNSVSPRANSRTRDALAVNVRIARQLCREYSADWLRLALKETQSHLNGPVMAYAVAGIRYALGLRSIELHIPEPGSIFAIRRPETDLCCERRWSRARTLPSLEKRNLGVIEVSHILDLPKSTASRWLSSMEQAEFLERDPDTGRYRLSLRPRRAG